MKLLLINPPITIREPRLAYISEPLALAYLEPYVSQRGYDVEIFDALGEALAILTPQLNGYRQGLTNEQIDIRLKDYSPDVVGITCNFSQFFRDAAEVADLCKKNFPNAPVILGGAHTAYEDIDILELFPAFDYIVRGEGEETLVELLDALRDRCSVKGILGLTYRHRDKVVRNPRRPVIKDLDLLPMPNRKALMMETYFKYKAKVGVKKNRNATTLITSRGCPYKCRFCSVAGIWGNRKWRAFSAERVLKEIKELYHDFGVRELSIFDDNFIVNKKRVLAILDSIIQSKLKINFTVSAGMNIWKLDLEFLEKLKNAGLYRLLLPIESAAPDTIRYMRKNIDLGHAKELISFAKRLGLWTEANFIIGFPYETEKHINETKNFILESGLDSAHIYIAMSIPGSDLLKDSIKEGLVSPTKRYSEIAYTRPPGSLALSAEKLKCFQSEINRAFWKKKLFSLLNPIRAFKYLYPRINSLSKLMYFTRLAKWAIRNKIYS